MTFKWKSLNNKELTLKNYSLILISINNFEQILFIVLKKVQHLTLLLLTGVYPKRLPYWINRVILFFIIFVNFWRVERWNFQNLLKTLGSVNGNLFDFLNHIYHTSCTKFFNSKVCHEPNRHYFDNRYLTLQTRK